MHRRPSPEALAKLREHFMCPTCEGREPEPDEEDYACCVFCFLEPPVLTPAAEDARAAKPAQRSAEAPRTRRA